MLVQFEDDSDDSAISFGDGWREATVWKKSNASRSNHIWG